MLVKNPMGGMVLTASAIDVNQIVYDSRAPAYVATVCLFDNKVTRNRGRVIGAEMDKLSKLLVACTVVTDHENEYWRKFGMVQRTWLERPGGDAVPGDPLVEIWAEIAIRQGHPIVEDFVRDLAIGSPSSVSITYFYTRMCCPNCDCDEDIWSRKCPVSYWDPDLEYFERRDVTDAWEVSVVAVPACRSARIEKLVEVDSK